MSSYEVHRGEPATNVITSAIGQQRVSLEVNVKAVFAPQHQNC